MTDPFATPAIEDLLKAPQDPAKTAGGNWAFTLALAIDLMQNIRRGIEADPLPDHSDLEEARTELADTIVNCNQVAREVTEEFRGNLNVREREWGTMAERMAGYVTADLRRVQDELDFVIKYARQDRNPALDAVEADGGAFVDQMHAAQAARLVGDEDAVDLHLRATEQTLNDMWRTGDVELWRRFVRGMSYRTWSLCGWWPFD